MKFLQRYKYYDIYYDTTEYLLRHYAIFLRPTPQHALVALRQFDELAHDGVAVLFQHLNARESQRCAEIAAQGLHVRRLGPQVRDAHRFQNDAHHGVGKGYDVVFNPRSNFDGCRDVARNVSTCRATSLRVLCAFHHKSSVTP